MASDKPYSAPCFVTTIDLKLADKLLQELKDQGFKITKPEHTLFSAQKIGVSCTLYASGKLTVQGKNKKEFIAYYLEPEILHTFTFSYPEVNLDFTPHIGIDEAGKGDFFGPLCIGGVYANEEQIRELIKIGARDSKKMSDQSVLKLSKKIRAICQHSIVRISPPKYNELYENFRNLNSLLAWGHATAITELVGKTGCREVIIDQFASEHVVKNALKRKAMEVHLCQRHGAEADPVVAAASILARAAFLEGLEQLGKTVAMELPKGASSKVVDAGKALVSKYGEKVLATVAKLHFKTKNDVLN